VVGAEPSRDQGARRAGADRLAVAEEEAVERVGVGRRQVPSSNLGMKFRLDVGVLDGVAVVGRGGRDDVPPGEAAPANDLVGSRLPPAALPVGLYSVTQSK